MAAIPRKRVSPPSFMAAICVQMAGRRALGQREKEFFRILGVGSNDNLAFACQPAYSGVQFLVFEFCDLFELFGA